jgi:hypothetical protein
MSPVRHLKGALSARRLALAGLLGLGLVACSQQTDHYPAGWGQGSQVVTPASTTTATGPFPRGHVTSATALDLSKRGPRITVVSPDRGAQIQSTTQVNVRLQLQTVNTVSSVTIQGIQAQALGSGIYEALVTLTPGTNFIHSEAVDNLGQKGESTFSLVQGSFQPLDQYLPQTVVASLSNDGLAKIEPLLTQLATQIDFAALVMSANPIVNVAGLVTVNATALTYDPPQTSLQGILAGGQLTLIVNHVKLDVTADVAGQSLAQAEITADTLFATMPIEVNANPTFIAQHGALDLEVEPVAVTYQNLQFTSPSSFVAGVLSGVKPQLTGMLTNLLSQTFQTHLQTFLDHAQLAGVNQPAVVPVPTLNSASPANATASVNTTAPVTIQFQGAQAEGSPSQGLALALDGKVTAATPFTAGATTQVLVTGATPPLGLFPSNDFACLLSTDAVDAFLQAYWLAGGLTFQVDGQTLGTQLLTARILYPFLPQVKELAPDGDTPVVIELSSASPPLATLGGSGTPVMITLGEAEIRLSLDYRDGQPPLELFTIRVPLELSAQLSVTNGAIAIQNLQAPVVSVDLVNEPVTPLDDYTIDNFLQMLLPYVLDQFKDQIPPIPIPALPPGYVLSNAGLGTGSNYLEVWGDF